MLIKSLKFHWLHNYLSPLRINMYVYMCVHVSMRIWISRCVCVNVYVFAVWQCVRLWMCLGMYQWKCMCLLCGLSLFYYKCVCVCVCVCMCVCVCVPALTEIYMWVCGINMYMHVKLPIACLSDLSIMIGNNCLAQRKNNITLCFETLA